MKLFFPFSNNNYNLEGKWWHRLSKVIYIIIMICVITISFIYFDVEENIYGIYKNIQYKISQINGNIHNSIKYVLSNNFTVYASYNQDKKVYYGKQIAVKYSIEELMPSIRQAFADGQTVPNEQPNPDTINNNIVGKDYVKQIYTSISKQTPLTGLSDDYKHKYYSIKTLEQLTKEGKVASFYSSMDAQKQGMQELSKEIQTPKYDNDLDKPVDYLNDYDNDLDKPVDYLNNNDLDKPADYLNDTYPNLKNKKNLYNSYNLLKRIISIFKFLLTIYLISIFIQFVYYKGIIYIIYGKK